MTGRSLTWLKAGEAGRARQCRHVRQGLRSSSESNESHKGMETPFDSCGIRVPPIELSRPNTENATQMELCQSCVCVFTRRVPNDNETVVGQVFVASVIVKSKRNNINTNLTPTTFLALRLSIILRWLIETG